MIEAKVSAVSMLVLANALHCFTKSQYWVLRGSRDGTVERTAHSLMSCTQPVSDDNTCRRSDHSCSETATCRLALIHVTISVYQSISNHQSSVFSLLNSGRVSSAVWAASRIHACLLLIGFSSSFGLCTFLVLVHDDVDVFLPAAVVFPVLSLAGFSTFSPVISALIGVCWN